MSPEVEGASSPRDRWRAWALVLAGFVAALGFVAWRVETDPRIVFLRDERGAGWIHRQRLFSLIARGTRATEVTEFRARVDLAADADRGESVLFVRALRAAVVEIDGRLLHDDGESPALADWRKLRRIEIPPDLAPGPHELRIRVANHSGPTALLARSDLLGVGTRTEWLARSEDGPWKPAVSVDEFAPPRLSRAFPPVSEAMAGLWPAIGGTFIALALVGFALQARARDPRLRRWRPGVRGLCWLLTLAWVVLAVNNLPKLPLEMGFDYQGHIAYIDYVLRRAAIPLATEGWQMFQSPLYYVLSALLAKLLLLVASPVQTVLGLRLIPMACGALHVVLARRAARAVFPDREGLQIAATVVGGLMPMNLYMSQSLGNEPLAAVWSAFAVALTLEVLREPQLAAAPRRQLGLGAVLGLGLLTKATLVLLVAPVAVAWAAALRRAGGTGHAIAAAGARIGSVCALVSGWYYARNWVLLGRPFVGGWEPERGIVWWQDPGYRTWTQYLSFGESLAYPIYAGYRSVWDGLHATMWLDGMFSGAAGGLLPPWNRTLLLGGAWLGLIPLALMLVGVAAAPWMADRTARRGVTFAAATIGLYLSALLWLSLTLPTYSTVKASYTLGLLPCYGVLAASGLERLARRPWLRPPLAAGLACWAAFSYAAYFVRG